MNFRGLFVGGIIVLLFGLSLYPAIQPNKMSYHSVSFTVEDMNHLSEEIAAMVKEIRNQPEDHLEWITNEEKTYILACLGRNSVEEGRYSIEITGIEEDEISIVVHIRFQEIPMVIEPKTLFDLETGEWKIEKPISVPSLFSPTLAKPFEPHDVFLLSIPRTEKWIIFQVDGYMNEI